MLCTRLPGDGSGNAQLLLVWLRVDGMVPYADPVYRLEVEKAARRYSGFLASVSDE